MRRWIPCLVMMVSVSLPGFGRSPLPGSQTPVQEPAAEEKVPRISLAEVRGTPGGVLMMPFAFTPDPASPVRSLSLDISFVSNTLNFEKTNPGMAAELAGADIRASLSEGEADEKGLKRATLRVEVDLPEGASEGLPEGVLAYLLFRVDPEAKAVRVRLTPKLVSAEDLSTPPLQVSVTTEPGVGVVSGIEPVIGCFFYMH